MGGGTAAPRRRGAAAPRRGREKGKEKREKEKEGGGRKGVKRQTVPSPTPASVAYFLQTAVPLVVTVVDSGTPFLIASVSVNQL